MLRALKNNTLRRVRKPLTRLNHNEIIIDGKRLIDFSGNNYLGLAQDPIVTKSFADAALKYGLGSTASPLLAGYLKPHQALEEAFADYLGREKAILFNSGYHANLAVMTTFADRHSIVIADKHCHASLIDGITLSRAQHARFHHLDETHAEELLSTHKHKLLVTESVFSMEGNITNLNNYYQLAKKHNAMLVVDDAHGVGVIDKPIGGIDCLITPLGKAVASMGAIVSGSNELIESLIQFARTYRYSTAISPAICAATLTALKLLQQDTWRREKLLSLIRFFNKEAALRGLTLISNDETPIRCVLIGDNQGALDISSQLQEKGFLVSCIRPPSVPENTARLRITLNCMHDESEIIRLLDSLAMCRLG